MSMKILAYLRMVYFCPVDGLLCLNLYQAIWGTKMAEHIPVGTRQQYWRPYIQVL